MFLDLDAFFNGLTSFVAALVSPTALPPGARRDWQSSLDALRAGLSALWKGEGDWHTLEERCRLLGFVFAGLLVSVAVWRRDALVVPARYPACQRRTKTRWLSRTVKTTCGVVPLYRREARCGRCKYYPARSPVHVALGLPKHDHVSPGLAVWAAKLGAALPYAAAAKFLRSWSGQDIASPKGTHDLSRRLGVALPEVPDVKPATTPGALPERMVVDADAAVVGLHKTAKRAPTDERFELWVGRTYERHEVGYGGEHVYRHLAFGGGCNRAGDDVATALAGLVARRFLHAIPERVVYVRGDGGQLLDTLAGKFPHNRRLLDLYHTLVKVSERVKEAFPDLHFKDRKPLADALCERLRAGDAPSLLTLIGSHASHPGLGAKEPLERLGKHLGKHADHLWYPEAAELGLGVGTAIAEKDVDLVLDRRYELRGMSWSPTGARDNLRVRLTFFNECEDALLQAAR